MNATFINVYFGERYIYKRILLALYTTLQYLQFSFSDFLTFIT